jgi:hypothetical protein
MAQSQSSPSNGVLGGGGLRSGGDGGSPGPILDKKERESEGVLAAAFNWRGRGSTGSSPTACVRWWLEQSRGCA